MPFDFEELGLGVMLIKPKVFPDNRGYFKEVFKESEFKKMGIPIPLQVNVSYSKRGVIRGLHYQLQPKEQGKIVTVLKGKILDVAVDVRRSSQNFGKYVYTELNEENHFMLWIPPGFAHGFQALKDSVVLYFVTHNEYSPQHERCINYSYVKEWNKNEVILSDKDAKCPPIDKAEVFE
ncbi:dTDP-4-dehydrorhamnose 3,5-epimerase [Sulfolobus sp. S-194]|uniref:dTDP-4-dehydrorhamnose 3,5-epimerase n=1 Tax=Sulfolobus sp. S-194 TaxID=2512240 RepID=UPI001436F0BE|nr:dTDP-4-dehydrorhamnose 3,5-epimerase [Sulfolobus sp. S-194]QIW24514.1 dTDP-4-dehydrorhamnose 3,5-epimerase [Sulfolobus sp. S-194]